MEPRIQYAKTRDGVSIAFWTLGEGPPVVWMVTPPFSNIRLEWQLPVARRAYERFAQTRMLVRYDGRGSGLSEGDVRGFSLEAHAADLEAVIEKVGLARVALLAYFDAGPIAILYGAKNPEKVTRLVLWGAYARGGFEDTTQIQGLHGLLDRDWQLFAETVALSMFGWSGGEQAARQAEFIAQCTTPDAVKAVWDASANIDVTELLPGVLCPTLVLHPSLPRWIDIDQSRLLASGIPNARMAVLEGVSGASVYNEAGVPTAIDDFLREGEAAATGAEPPPGAFRTVLFTDIVGHSEMMSRLTSGSRTLLKEAST